MNVKLKTVFLAGLVALGISACKTSGGAMGDEVSYTPITTLVSFQGGVIGNRLSNEGRYKVSIVIAENGTWEGKLDGKNIGGSWTWKDGYWCRTMKGRADDCQLFEMSNKFNEIKVTRNRGQGKNFKYKIGQL